MKNPQWVLFDYGETLVHEENRGIRAGYEAVLARATANPQGAAVEDILALSGGIFLGLVSSARERDIEFVNANAERLVYEILRLEFNVSYEELDEVFWDAAHPGTPSPGMPEFLAFLKEQGISTGVVSNMGFSGASLRRRLDRLLPDNDFRFVIASSDYAVRKPCPALFRLALVKTGAHPGAVWYVGDNARADVEGASSAGMYPVWYRSGLACDYRDARADATPGVPHLRVTDIMELARLIGEE